jgi:chromosome partitioning protein
MAFTITIAQRKGGAGKTTLACHLIAAFARRGYSVGAADIDEQKSLTHWAGLRAARFGALDFDLDQSEGYSLAWRLRRLRQRAALIIIDTPPTIDREVVAAVKEADLVLAPLQLSPLDLDASLPTARMISAAIKPALFVINRAPPRARVADKIRAEISARRLPVARTEIGSRATFAESLATGRTALETEPSSAAAREIDMLADQLADIMGPRLAVPRVECA